MPGPAPVDALDVPADQPGFRTVFNAFHHFGSDDARQLLADTVADGSSGGIFELTERRLLAGLFVAATSVPPHLGAAARGAPPLTMGGGRAWAGP